MTAGSLAIVVVLQAAAPAPAPFPEQVVHELAALCEGVTPAAWLTTHPQDGLVTFRRDSIRENHASWCARAALAIDRDSPEARVAWLEAWRLLAGLPPSTTHFFCVYD